MPPASARAILYVSALAIGLASLGDPGRHRLTGNEHGPSHAGSDDDAGESGTLAEGDCPLDRDASEPGLATGARRAIPIAPPAAKVEAASPAAERLADAHAAATPRAPPASA
ncbi:hypothetical protein [Paludisphaera sp.]|uniref:hypothetical protein n=1 Tax=Paludisphaera sp. TaxID=2017432 RepID=UPI00301C881E